MSKRLLRILLIPLALSVMTFALIRHYFGSEAGLRGLYAIPGDAIYIIETTEPFNAWDRLSNNPAWQHLKTHPLFNEIAEGADALDSMLHDNPYLTDLIGDRQLLISAHMIKRNDYDFLYVADLENPTWGSLLTDNPDALSSEGYKISKRTYHDHTIVELYDTEDKETLYISAIQNLLVASYTHTLVEKSIDEVSLPDIGRDLRFIRVQKEADGDDVLRLYVQYNRLQDYLRCYTTADNPYVRDLSRALAWSGISVTWDDALWKMRGFTLSNDSIPSYLQALQHAGTGKRSAVSVMPHHTAFCLSLGFGSFGKFLNGLEQVLQKDTAAWSNYRHRITQMEKLLKIDFRKHFTSWIDDEAAFVQMQPSGLGKNNEMAFYLKTTDPEEARKNLDFIKSQVRRKTPIRFKEITYKGHVISFLSVKGFFKLLLGDFFSGLDKPYYTFIGDFVVFSNHPQTLKRIINDYQSGETLAADDDFKAFAGNLDEKVNVFAYVQMPLLTDNLKPLVSADTWQDISRNKPYLVCFSQIGLTLKEDGDGFDTKLAIGYLPPDSAMVKWANPIAKHETSNEPDTTHMVSVSEDEIINLDEITPDDLDADLHQELFPDGSVMLEVNMKDGEKHGNFREYHPNGNLKIKGRYKHDQKNGTWKFYDEEGNLLEKRRYRDGSQM